MPKKKRCDFCSNKSTIVIDGKNLCSKHYFHRIHAVDETFGPNSREENHWSFLLRDLRSEAKISQRELARMTKMSQRTIADYENFLEPRQLSIYKVERLLKAFGYDLDAVWVKKNV